MVVLTNFLLLAFMAGSMVNQSKSERKKKIYLACVFIFVFVYSAFRGASVGIDTEATLNIYKRIAENGIDDLPRNTEIEKGYMVLCYALSRIFPNPQTLTIIISTFVSYSFYSFIKKFSKNYMISSVIFISSIFTITMNVSRQFFAISFVLFAIVFMYDKKPLETMIMLLLAASMHYTSLIFLPLWILSLPKFRFTTKMLAFIGGLSLLAVPFYLSLVSLLLKFFPQYGRFLSNGRYSASSEISISFILFMLALLAVDLWTIIPAGIKGDKLFLYKSNLQKETDLSLKNEDEELHNFFLLMFIEYIVFYIISTKLWMASRMVYYFQVFLLAFVPNMIHRYEKNRRQKIVAMLITCVVIIHYLRFGYHYFINDPHGVLPYKFFWN